MKKEEIIALIDECEEAAKKCVEDEDYAMAFAIKCNRKVEQGDVKFAVKLAVTLALTEELEEGEDK